MRRYRQEIHRIALGNKRDNKRDRLDAIVNKFRDINTSPEEKVRLYHIYKRMIVDNMVLFSAIKSFLPAEDLTELLKEFIGKKREYRIEEVLRVMKDRDITPPEDLVRKMLSKESWDYEKTPRFLRLVKVPKDIVSDMVWNDEHKYDLLQNPENKQYVREANESLGILQNLIAKADVEKLNDVFDKFGKFRLPLELVIDRLSDIIRDNENSRITPEQKELLKKVFATGIETDKENTNQHLKKLLHPIEKDDELFSFATHALLENSNRELVFAMFRGCSTKRVREGHQIVEAKRRKDEQNEEYSKHMYNTTNFLLGMSQNAYAPKDVLESILKETESKLIALKTTNYASTERTTLMSCYERLFDANELVRHFLEQRDHTFAADILEEMAERLDRQSLDILLPEFIDKIVANPSNSKYDYGHFFNSEVSPEILESLFVKIPSDEIKAELVNEYSHRYKFLLKYAKAPEGFSGNSTSQKLFKHMRALKNLEDLFDRSGLEKISPKELKKLQPELLGNPIIVELFRASNGKPVDKEAIRAFAEGYSGSNYDVFWGNYHKDVQVDKDLDWQIRNETPREVFALGMTDLDPATDALLSKIDRKFHNIGFKGKNLGWILFRNITKVMGYPAILIEQIQSDMRNLDDILKDFYEYKNKEGYVEEFESVFGKGSYETSLKKLKDIGKNYGELILSGFLQRAAGFAVFISTREKIKEVAKLSDVAATELYQKLPQRFGFKPTEEIPGGYLKLDRAAISKREIRRTAMKKKYYLVGWSDFGSPEFRSFSREENVREFLSKELGLNSGKDTVRRFDMDEEDYKLLCSRPTDYKLIQKRKELADDLKERFVSTVGKLWEKPIDKSIPNSPEELLNKKRPWFWKDKTNSSVVISQREMNFIQMMTPAMGESAGHATYGVQCVSPKKAEVFPYLWNLLRGYDWGAYYQGGQESKTWFYIEFMLSKNVDEGQLKQIVSEAAEKFGMELR